MKQRKSPEIINLPEGKLDEIKTRFEAGSSLEEDKKIILLILSTYAWLHRQLKVKKIGIQRLRSLFGFSTEVRSKLKKKDDDNIPSGLNGSSDATTQSDTLSGGNVTPLKKHPIGIQKKIMGE